MNHKYRIKRVIGNCPQFFSNLGSTHIYLLAWHKKIEAKVLEDLRLNPTQFPADTLIIDPSFKAVLPAELGQGYKIRELFDIEKVNFSRNFQRDFTNMPDGSFTALPLGYLKNFIIHPPTNINPESLLYLAVGRNQCSEKLGIQAPTDIFATVFQEHENLIPKNHILNQLIQKLNQPTLKK